jgi:pyruvate dehydrogenase E1 component alpha subunit/2-oxoisovalerate dehydrogenase E1 component alpha subunit
VPLVVVATNNHYSYSTPNDRTFACADLVDRAKGYGYEGYNVDGTDLAACLDVIETAVKRARAGRPPQLVVAETLRLAGHGEHDDASYVTDEIKREPFAQDALQRTEKFILDQGFLDRDALKKMRTEIVAEVDEAVAIAQQEDPPQASDEDWCALTTRQLVDQPAL